MSHSLSTSPTQHRGWKPKPMPHAVTGTSRGIAAAVLTILALLLGTVPAAAAGPTVVRNHDLTLKTEYHVLEFNPEGDDFTANSTSTIHTKAMAAGTVNPASFGMLSNPTEHNLRSRTQFTISEKDSTGTLTVKTDSVLFLGNYPVASTTITVDVGPNQWRAFWIYTDNGHNSYAHDLVTITNVVT